MSNNQIAGGYTHVGRLYVRAASMNAALLVAADTMDRPIRLALSLILGGMPVNTIVEKTFVNDLYKIYWNLVGGSVPAIGVDVSEYILSTDVPSRHPGAEFWDNVRYAGAMAAQYSKLYAHESVQPKRSTRGVDMVYRRYR